MIRATRSLGLAGDLPLAALFPHYCLVGWKGGNGGEITFTNNAMMSLLMLPKNDVTM